MAVEHQWTYERVASPGDADGRTCIFCGKQIVDESQPGYWVEKVVEDNQDADFVRQDGYAHHECTQTKLSESRRSRFTLPDVPGGPSGR
jgi:hypothetical protein